MTVCEDVTATKVRDLPMHPRDVVTVPEDPLSKGRRQAARHRTKALDQLRNLKLADILACSECGASRVQLWQLYGGYHRDTQLRCGPCSEHEQGESREGDRIGWRVPLVVGEGGAIWGIFGAPDIDVQRWRALPVKPSGTP